MLRSLYGCCYFCIAQVVLKQDVPGLGSEGSLKSVPVGYWRNYLQPQGLAAFADAGILEAIRRKLEEEERLRLEEKAKAQAMVGLTRCESRLFGQELPAWASSAWLGSFAVAPLSCTSTLRGSAEAVSAPHPTSPRPPHWPPSASSSSRRRWARATPSLAA
jgi:hypothetical protein